MSKPSDDKKAIRIFLDSFDRLLACLREIGGFDRRFTQFSISWGANGIRRDASMDIEDKDLSYVLHRLRPFLLPNNKPDVSFCTTIERVKRVMAYSTRRSPRAKERMAWMEDFFKEIKNDYSGATFRHLMVISHVDPSRQAEEVVNCEKKLNDWLYGYEYHQDQGKQESIKSMEKPLPDGSLRNVFMIMIGDKISAIDRLVAFIRLYKPTLIPEESSQ